MSREAQILKEFQEISYSKITGDLMDPDFILKNQETLQEINKVIDKLKKKQVPFSLEELKKKKKKYYKKKKKTSKKKKKNEN